MTEISRIPAGLLGFLNIKNFGKNPKRLTEELVGTWDLQRLYLEYEAEFLSVVSDTNAAGYVVQFSPDPGEVWFVHDFSCVFTAGAGEAFNGAIARGRQNGNDTVNLTGTAAIGASASLSLACDRSLIVTPGENLGYVGYLVTGTVDTYCSIRFTRLRM